MWRNYGIAVAPDTVALPSLDEIFSSRIATVKYVPKAARVAWGECLTSALSAAFHYNTTAAWTELAMLAKAVLCSAPRAGKAGRGSTVCVASSRLCVSNE